MGKVTFVSRPLKRALDMEPSIEGKSAARELLSRIHSMDSQLDVVTQAKMAHAVRYQESGSQGMGNVAFPAGMVATPAPHYLKAYLRPGLPLSAILERSPNMSRQVETSIRKSSIPLDRKARML